jgi:signal transduction histidine kinase
MNQEQLKKLNDTCTAWLQGDWQELQVQSEVTGEEAQLYKTLSGLREILIASSKNVDDCNSRYEQLEDRVREEEILLNAAKILTSTLDFDVLLKTTTEKIAEMFKLSDGATLFIYDEERDELVCRASYGYPEVPGGFWTKPDEGAPGLVFQVQEPVLAVTEEEVARLYDSVKSNAHPILDNIRHSHLPSQSVLCVPFIARGKVIGSLQLEHWKDAYTFTQKDLHLLVRLADLIAIAVDNGLLWRELGKKEERLHHMVGQLLTAQEVERKRIATEIHDDASQALTIISIGLTNLSDSLPPELTEMHERIQNLRAEIKEIMGTMRDLSFTLRPSVLDDLGLVAALKWYVSRFTESQSPRIILELGKIEKDLDPAVATILFRVAQEALNNAIRHSQADEIKISLKRYREALVMKIEDDGRGFDSAKLMQDPRESFGLYGMSERLALVNGSLKIISTPGHGSIVRARVPVLAE